MIVAIGLEHLVDHAGRGGDQVLVELALQPLLHDLHVQQAQKAAAKAKAQRLADLGLVVQRSIVELELFQRVAQRLVLAGFGRVQAGKHLGLDFLETGQGLGGGEGRAARAALDQRDGVAHPGRLQFLDAGNDVAHLAGFQRLARLVVRREHAQLLGVVGRFAGHQLDAVALGQAAIDHAHQHDHADIGVVPAVDDHGAQGGVRVALGRRESGRPRLRESRRCPCRSWRCRESRRWRRCRSRLRFPAWRCRDRPSADPSC